MIILQEYGRIAGYKINQKKSEIRGINIEIRVRNKIQEITQGKW